MYNSYELLKYVILMWVIFYIVVLIYEEPMLKRQFGESYERYRKSVRRWLPGRRYKQSA